MFNSRGYGYGVFVPAPEAETQREQVPEAEVYRIGGGVSLPRALYKVEPEYSEKALNANFQGNVVLGIVIDVDGKPKNIKVLRPLGLGLDEKAIACVRQWRFRPATKEGQPVPVLATVEINFRLPNGQ